MASDSTKLADGLEDIPKAMKPITSNNIVGDGFLNQTNVLVRLLIFFFFKNVFWTTKIYFLGCLEPKASTK